MKAVNAGLFGKPGIPFHIVTDGSLAAGGFWIICLYKYGGMLREVCIRYSYSYACQRPRV